MDLRVGTRFRIGKKLGFGSFGEIFSGTNATTGEEIAVKLEPIKTRHPQLLYEYRMYRILSGGGLWSNFAQLFGPLC